MSPRLPRRRRAAPANPGAASPTPHADAPSPAPAGGSLAWEPGAPAPPEGAGTPEASAAGAPTAVHPVLAAPAPGADPGDEATAVLVPVTAGGDVALAPPAPGTPAGLEAQAAPDPRVPVPSWRTRGRLRRRLRHLRRLRELGFRDLGGLSFDLHRFGRDGRALVQGKLEGLTAIDAELRALERALDEHQDFADLREAGIAACPRCATLHGSDAHFCPSCGLHLDGPLALAPVGDPGAPPSEPATDAEVGGAPAGDATALPGEHPPAP